ncbi:hypothetical protein BEH94_00135 [Candidatus Altiarchaeales archaeon WOR_SM1_SCG]|nr:hypothetical protein BEH94_00135 [Candidatus Altiarchaeales archaeon WOR_SM1_SCG]
MKQVSTTEIKLSMERFEKDGDWFCDRFNEFQKKYAGKVIAVKNQKIIVVTTKLDDLLKKIRSRGEDPADVYIDSIPEKGVAYIL